MIKRLLVANRSEIAVRIMATASVLGIETVAVYAADDAACGHVSRADAAVELQASGPGAFDVGWVDAHAAELATAEPQESGLVSGVAPSADTEVRAPLAGPWSRSRPYPGARSRAGDELLVIEAMKMEHEVRAPVAGWIRQVPVTAGATVQAGAVLIVLAESADEVAGPARAGDIPLNHVRPDLAEVRERHRIGLTRAGPNDRAAARGGAAAEPFPVADLSLVTGRSARWG